ncbi:MAG: cyclic nucleotide-binding domain-containing protein [Pyrinomonadaceae bacterium]|nr:cyclic nucleotide-binding domain-containing protein [Pyrinomonadaceae bacterium]
MNTDYQVNSGCFLGQPFSSDQLFSELSAEKFRTLTERSRKIRFKKGNNILSNGKLPECVYILSRGKAEISTNFNEKKQNIRLIMEDEIIGLPEILGNFPTETNVETLTDCECECIPRELFIDLLLEEPKVCLRLLKIFSENLQKSYKLFSSLTS